MRMRFRLSYNGLDHLAPLFTALHTQYPEGSVWFEMVGDDVQLELDTGSTARASERDRRFFRELQDRNLISSWFHDARGE